MNCPIERGLAFLKAFAGRHRILEAYGHDVLFLFLHVATTSRRRRLRTAALKTGRFLAERWRQRQRVPRDSDALVCVLIAEQAAHDLGYRDPVFRQRLRSALRVNDIVRCLGFDPGLEPPPADLPEYCPRCESENARGRRTCAFCRKQLEFLSRYRVWLDSLVVTEHFKRWGPIANGMYTDAVRWIRTMRPYPSGNVMEDSEAWEAAYAITHVIYTLSHYSRRRLSLRWLEQEYEHLRTVLPQALAGEDCDLVGECVDTLATFGLSRKGRVLQPSVRFLTQTQNHDGSWGSPTDDDHTRIHTTWAAIDGIRDHLFRGRQVNGRDIARLIHTTSADT